MASGLALDSLPGNTAKIRLILDLARQVCLPTPHTRILDVGAGGRYVPFNLWEPFVPYADAISLSGVDVAHSRRDRAPCCRARLPGRPPSRRSASRLLETFGATPSTPSSRPRCSSTSPTGAAESRSMTQALRPGGTLYITCDSGDLLRPPGRGSGSPGSAPTRGSQQGSRRQARRPGAQRRLGEGADPARAPRRTPSASGSRSRRSASTACSRSRTPRRSSTPTRGCSGSLSRSSSTSTGSACLHAPLSRGARPACARTLLPDDEESPVRWSPHAFLAR